MIWDDDALAALIVSGGFVGESAVTAFAVSRAENGAGDDANVNRSAGETPPDQPAGSCASYGLFQINYCPHRDAGTRPPPDQLLDPFGNVRAAYTISGQGSNFRPWTTYREGKHAPFLARGRAAVAKFPDPAAAKNYAISHSGAHVGGGIFDGIAGGITNPLGAAQAALSAAASFLGLLTSWTTWRRILYLIAGAGLVLAATAFILSDTRAGGELAGDTIKGALLA